MTDLFTPRICIPLASLPPEPEIDARHWFPMRGKTVAQSIAIFDAWKAQGKKGANPTLPSSNGETWCGWCRDWTSHEVTHCPKLDL